MEYFTTLTTSGLVDLINKAKHSVYLCLPSIHKELSDAIYNQKSRDDKNSAVRLQVLIDFDAQTFRQGYGALDSIERIQKANIDLKNLPDNRISFVIVDDTGYYLFIESRSLIPANKETINAVRIDPVSMVRLKHFFFPEDNGKELANNLANAIIEESRRLKSPDQLITSAPATVKTITSQRFEEVKADLGANPPLNPDYQRIVNIYSNKFQYIRLKFEGANLQYLKIEIPSKALPIIDATLKQNLETKLNLFDRNKESEYFKPLDECKARIAEIREKFLTKVKSREESLLDKKRKTEFEAQVKKIKEQLVIAKTATIKNLVLQIGESKKRLLRDLQDFFIANPKALFPDHSNLWEADNELIEQSAKDMANEIIYRIQWPKAHKLVDRFDLTIQYSDITFEDLRNKSFISELEESGLIDQNDLSTLADMGKGIVTQ